MRPGLSTPLGSKLSFTRFERGKRRASGSNTSTRPATRPAPAPTWRDRRFGDRVPDRAGIGFVLEWHRHPDQAAGPVVEHLRRRRDHVDHPVALAGRVEIRHSGRARARSTAKGVTSRMLLQRSRESFSSSIATGPNGFINAASACAVLDRRRESLQPQDGRRFGRAEAVEARRDMVGQMRGAGDVERRAHRRRHRLPGCASSRPLTIDRGLRLRLRQHLDGDVGHDGERAPGPGHQFTQVVAGDVLHHPAARFDGFAPPGDRGQTEKMIARRARLDAARARKFAAIMPPMVPCPGCRPTAARNPSARNQAADGACRAAPRSR